MRRFISAQDELVLVQRQTEEGISYQLKDISSMIPDLDASKQENVTEEDTQEKLLDQISKVKKQLEEREAEQIQVKSTLGAMNAHNSALRGQINEGEKKLNQEMGLKLR